MRSQLLLLSFLVIDFNISAQDSIRLKGGVIELCKILQVGPDVVQYKKGNPADGPLYVRYLWEVEFIRVESGERQYFKDVVDNPGLNASGFQPIILLNKTLFYDDRPLAQTRMKELIDDYPDAERRPRLQEEFKLMLRYKRKQHFWSTAGPIAAGVVALVGLTATDESNAPQYTLIGAAAGIGILVTSMQQARNHKKRRLHHASNFVQLYNSR